MLAQCPMRPLQVLAAKGFAAAAAAAAAVVVVAVPLRLTSAVNTQTSLSCSCLFAGFTASAVEHFCSAG